MKLAPIVFAALICLALGVAFFVYVVRPTIRDSHESDNSVRCGSNLRRIGVAMLDYANQHGGHYPDAAATLITNQDVAPELFVCPSSDDEPAAAGATRTATAANVATAGHLSYVFTSRSLTTASPADAVLAYEPLTNHRGRGIHVLCADGHVDWADVRLARLILSELKAGHNPPRPDAIK
jgi:hypothetical protein